MDESFVTNRLARLISYIHHTCEFRQYWYVGNKAQQCRVGLFQDSDFAEDLEDSTSTSGGLLCIVRSQTFVPTSWMRKRSHTVQQKPSLYLLMQVYAWMEYQLLIFGIWAIVEVFHSSPTQSKKTKDQARGNSSRDTTSNKHNQNQTEDPTKHNNLELSEF